MGSTHGRRRERLRRALAAAQSAREGIVTWRRLRKGRKRGRIKAAVSRRSRRTQRATAQDAGATPVGANVRRRRGGGGAAAEGRLPPARWGRRRAVQLPGARCPGQTQRHPGRVPGQRAARGERGDLLRVHLVLHTTECTPREVRGQELHHPRLPLQPVREARAGRNGRGDSERHPLRASGQRLPAQLPAVPEAGRQRRRAAPALRVSQESLPIAGVQVPPAGPAILHAAGQP